MNKFKLFIENFLVYGLGSVISKIIPLIMLPIITYLLDSSAYMGIGDMSTTIISFAGAISIMGMYDAMYRLFFEKEDDDFKRRVCSTTLFFTLITTMFVVILMLVFRKPLSELFFTDSKYEYLIFVAAAATLVGSSKNIISAPTRMQNKKKIFLIMNTVGPIVSYSISVPMIKMGYFVIALPLAALISNITMEVAFIILNHSWFSIRKFDRKLLKPLLVIAVPLLPNFIIYWIFNSCDKLMITSILGLEAQGVYAVSSKLGSMSQLIYSAFAGGWQYFAFSTMKDKEQVKNNSNIFEYLGAISYVAFAFVCALSPLIYELFFPEEYYIGYISAPYLFLAPLLLMLFQVACNQFIVVKKTWPNFLILSAGAIANVLLNLILIPIMGIEGASVATLAGYIISDIIVVIVLCRMKLMIITFRMVFSAALTMVYLLVWRFFAAGDVLKSIPFAMLFAILTAVLYRSELKMLLHMIKGMKRNRTEAKEKM